MKNSVKLETQIEQLAQIGLGLSPGVTIDDLLYSFGRADYEKPPFDLLLYSLGVEVERQPWGRPISPHAWNFDTECIAGDGDYVRIVRKLCALSGDPEYLRDVADSIDISMREGSLSYRCGDTTRDWSVEINDDWADLMVVSYVIDDIERDGKRFYTKDNGQAMVLFYLDADTAARVNALSGGALALVNV